MTQTLVWKEVLNELFVRDGYRKVRRENVSMKEIHRRVAQKVGNKKDSQFGVNKEKDPDKLEALLVLQDELKTVEYVAAWLSGEDDVNARSTRNGAPIIWTFETDRLQVAMKKWEPFMEGANRAGEGWHLSIEPLPELTMRKTDVVSDMIEQAFKGAPNDLSDGTKVIYGPLSDDDLCQKYIGKLEKLLAGLDKEEEELNGGMTV